MSNSHCYGSAPSDFEVGKRVWIHPATDTWMRGDISGRVEKIGRKFVTVRMSRSNRVLRFTADLLAFDSAY